MGLHPAAARKSRVHQGDAWSTPEAQGTHDTLDRMKDHSPQAAGPPPSSSADKAPNAASIESGLCPRPSRSSTATRLPCCSDTFGRGPGDQTGVGELEDALGSLRGRKFYGSFDPTTSQYAVCVVLRQGDDPRALGLQPGTIPGGKYVRVRLKGSHRPFMTSSRRRCRASRTGRTATRSNLSSSSTDAGTNRSPSSGASFVLTVPQGTSANARARWRSVPRPQAPDRGAGGVAHWRERPRVPGNRGRRALAERGDVQPDLHCTAGRRRSWRRLGHRTPRRYFRHVEASRCHRWGAGRRCRSGRCSHHLQRLPSQPGGGRLP